MSQYTEVYCDRQEGHEAGPCRGLTLRCIVTGKRGMRLDRVVRQATTRPASRAAQRLRHGHTRCDTAGGQAMTWPAVGHDTARSSHDTARARAPGRACVRRLVSRLCTWCTQPVF